MFDSLTINLVVAASFLITALVHLFSPNRYWRNLIFFVLVFIGLYAFLAPLDVTIDNIKEVLKGVFLPANSLDKQVAVVSNNKGTSIANLSFAIVAFVIAVVAGMVLSTVKDAEKRMKEQMDDIKKQLDTQKKLEGMQRLHDKVLLMSLSIKYGNYFNEKLLATQDNKISLYSILVKFFRVDIDNATLLQSDLEAIEQCHIKISMLRLDVDSIRQYFNLLAQYHEQKNPEISRLCQKIRNS